MTVNNIPVARNGAVAAVITSTTASHIYSIGGQNPDQPQLPNEHKGVMRVTERYDVATGWRLSLPAKPLAIVVLMIGELIIGKHLKTFLGRRLGYPEQPAINTKSGWHGSARWTVVRRRRHPISACFFKCI